MVQSDVRQEIRVYHEKRLFSQQLFSLFNSSASPQDFRFFGIDDLYAMGGAVSQERPHLVSQMVEVDDNFAYSVMGQIFQSVKEKRLAIQGNQRLGGLLRQRGHSGAKTGGKHHGFHDSSSGMYFASIVFKSLNSGYFARLQEMSFRAFGTY